MNSLRRGEGAMRAKVRDVMTTRVVAVKRNATFKDMAALLTEYRVSAFPVLDDEGKVIGVVSEADMLSKEALVADMGVQAAREPCGLHSHVRHQGFLGQHVGLRDD